MVAINKVLKVSFLKTFIFNVHYFGWRKGLFFPVIVEYSADIEPVVPM